MGKTLRINAQIAVLVTGLLVAACSGTSGSGFDSPAGLTPLEAHTRGQEAIAACMKEEGFDYRPVVLIETTDRGGIGHYSISEPERLGYGALLLAISDRLYQSPQQFPEGLSDADFMQYQEALWGPHPDEGEEDFVAQGCATEAAKAVPELGLIEQSREEYLDDWHQIIELGAYLEYSDAWQVCLKTEGYERPERSDSASVPVPESNGPMGAKSSYFYDHLSEFNRVIDESGAVIDPSAPNVSIDSILQIVDADPGLAALLGEEIRVATADAECRETLSSQYFDSYAELLTKAEEDNQ